MFDKPSIINVANIYIEDLYEWMNNKMSSGGGDEFVVLICKNYEDAAKWFIEWFFKETTYGYRLLKENNYNKPKMPFDIIKKGNHIYFVNGQEGFIFTNNIDCYLNFHEYTFRVVETCYFGYLNDLEGNSLKDKILEPVNA